MRRELRCKLEREVKEFQDNLQRDEDSAYFRQLEADRLRGKFQLASQSALYWRKKKTMMSLCINRGRDFWWILKRWSWTLGRILAERFCQIVVCFYEITIARCLILPFSPVSGESCVVKSQGTILSVTSQSHIGFWLIYPTSTNPTIAFIKIVYQVNWRLKYLSFIQFPRYSFEGNCEVTLP